LLTLAEKNGKYSAVLRELATYLLANYAHLDVAHALDVCDGPTSMAREETARPV